MFIIHAVNDIKHINDNSYKTLIGQLWLGHPVYIANNLLWLE
jgi:hypothetical protein